MADDPAEHEVGATDRGRVTRRRFLVAWAGAGAGLAVGLGGALVAGGVLPGRTRLRSALGLTGDDGTIPDVEPGPMASGSFDSRRRRTETSWAVSYPPGHAAGDALPVLVSLHGKGGTHRSTFDELGLDRFLADAVRRGVAPFAVAAVDGGDTYWHERADGVDSGAMVIDELVPRLADLGLDVSGVGLFGWSMGGYGALHLTIGGLRGRVRSVSTMSAALWTDASASAPGAFDDERDFEDDDVFDQQARLGDIPLRMDCGRDDPFAAANRTFRDGLDRSVDGGFQPGAHTVGYWRRMVPDHLAFAAANLTR